MTFDRLFDRLLSSRFWALFRKEVAQILHNRQLLIQLLLPPTIMLTLFGFALNPTFENLRVGITDYSHSRASREFLELFNQTTAFDIRKYYANEQDMMADLAKGNLTVGITVPTEFDRDLARQRPTQVQALFDAVDANTASVASGYLNQLVSDYNVQRLDLNQRRQGSGTIVNAPQTTTGTRATNNASTQSNTEVSTSSFDQTTNASAAPNRASTKDGSSSTNNALNSPNPSNTSTASTINTNSSNSSNSSNTSTASTTTSVLAQSDSGINPNSQRNQVQLETTIFYNPGLEGSWFIVPGTIGIVLTVIGSQAAASLVVREKEAGTIEQLLMTPASNTEVILAKICPLLILLTFDAIIALLVAKIAFNIPLRGNLFVFLSIAILYFLVSISIGIIIASYAKSEQQALLTTFFVNPPLVLLSGGTSPIAAMPFFMQWLSYLDPMRYFIEVCRGVLLKGVGFAELWFQVLVLLVFAIVFMTLSIRQFRHQLS